jgi:hypothetical protein
MFDTLFGAEVPLAAKVVLFFVAMIAVVGLVFWFVRRVGSDGSSLGRGRQPRLAVVDAASVDGRRKLVIIRRDNVEHLLMIGGPTDVVVEQNIVRAMGAPRDKSLEPSLGRGPSANETLTRPVPLGEATLWPLQPTAETNGRATKPAPAEQPMQWSWPAHAEPQRAAAPSPRSEPRLDAQPEPPPEPAPVRPAPLREPSFTRPTAAPAPAPAAAAPVRTAAAAPAATAEKPPSPAPAAAVPGDPDENLAEMANRLEASLRRGAEPRLPEPAAPAATPAVAPPAAPTRSEPLAAAPPPRLTPPDQKPARGEIKPAAPKAVYDSLEEEMASLLGRPPGKT